MKNILIVLALNVILCCTSAQNKKSTSNECVMCCDSNFLLVEDRLCYRFEKSEGVVLFSEIALSGARSFGIIADSLSLTNLEIEDVRRIEIFLHSELKPLYTAYLEQNVPHVNSNVYSLDRYVRQIIPLKSGNNLYALIGLSYYDNHEDFIRNTRDFLRSYRHFFHYENEYLYVIINLDNMSMVESKFKN